MNVAEVKFVSCRGGMPLRVLVSVQALEEACNVRGRKDRAAVESVSVSVLLLCVLGKSLVHFAYWIPVLKSLH